MATTATSGMPSTLNIPSADDTMEISSDAGRPDHDIDIDFMGSEHGDNDIDWMLQDAASERGNLQASTDQQALNDDLMYVDADDEITYVEEPMQEDMPAQTEALTEPTDLDIHFDPHPATEETLFDATDDAQQEIQEASEQPDDETLIDFDTYSDHEEQQFIDNQTAQGDQAAVGGSTHEDNAVEEREATPEQELKVLEQTGTQLDLAATADPIASGTQTADFAAIANKREDLEAQSRPSHERYRDELSPSDVTPTSQKNANGHASPVKQQQIDSDLISREIAATHGQPSLEQPPVPLHGLSADSTNNLGIASDALHPITVQYGRDEFPLFATSEDDDPNTYLLQDPLVASSTLIDFFRACRSVLDQDLNDDFQLEITINRLGLTIAEDSINCRDTSLAQIVEVYVALMHNDGVGTPEPLLMQLNIRDRFSAQLTNLFKAASEKKGFVQLALDSEAQQEHDRNEEEEEEQDGDFVLQEDGSQVEASTLDKATSKGPEDETADAGEDVATLLPESIPGTSNDATEQNKLQAQDRHDQEAIGHEHGDHVGEGSRAESEREEQLQQEFTENAEQGDGSSSGSSTVQGEIQPTPSRGYTPSIDEEEWLIDHSDEESDYDASSETVQVGHETTETQPQPVAEPSNSGEVLDDSRVGQEVDEAYDFNGDQRTESYDDSAYGAHTFDQEFDAYDEYGVDLDNHDEAQDEDYQHDEDHQDWTQDDFQPDADGVPIESTGTFQVPDASEGDEDEITFNDDDFTVDDAETQDATAQEHSPNSPLGKRSREDDGDDLLDGSDQELKRLKAA